MTDRMRPPLSASSDRTWASLAHFGNALGLVPPLLVFLILGSRGRLVRQESREALNFAITVVIAFVAVYILGTLSNTLYEAMPPGVRTLFLVIGLLFTLALFAVWISMIVFAIIAGVRVRGGDTYRYPFAIRLIR